MNPSEPWVRALRTLEFARHIPPSKVLRRLNRNARRMIYERLAAPHDPSPAMKRAPAPPQPIFRPRSGMTAGVGEGFLQLSLLGRSELLDLRRIDWKAPGPEAHHQLWRMTLHYMHYLEELPDPLWSALVTGWIDANPPHRRGSSKDSWNSYALSLRSVVWMQELARRKERLPVTMRHGVEASLARQIRFLESDLETDLGGNHLIKNIKALIWASGYFEAAEAERWGRLALKLLTAEMPRQILPDGMHYERSPSYHSQVFADLLECRHALGHTKASPALDAVLHSMAQVCADLAHPDGHAALFNDAGLRMAYSPEECLGVYERLFRRRPPPRDVFALRESGYFGLRSAESYFVADCGRIAPDDLPAHGHGDVLSFEWSVGGQRIVVDQGVFEYNEGARRDAARSAWSHNTLCLDGSDQAGFFGAFRCGRRPNVEVRRFERSRWGFLLEGSHDGFRHLPGSPVHLRRFEVAPADIVIRDRIEGRTDRVATISFLLHPCVQVEAEGSTVLLRSGGTRIALTAPASIDIEDAVWWPDMGQEFPARRLRVRLPDKAREAVTTLKVLKIDAARRVNAPEAA